MQKHNLNELIEYDDKRFHPKVLLNEPGYRMVLLSMRAGQSIPEHTTQGIVTVYAICGHITFYAATSPCEMHVGEVISIESGLAHRLEAHDDSAILVLVTGGTGFSVSDSEELDLREIPQPLRHPLVFQRFDALDMGRSFTITNDHDPLPLNRQMQSMRPGQVSWDYIQRGPDLFRIRIRRVAVRDNSDVPANKELEELVQEIHRV